MSERLSRRATMADVARLAGVSTATVSRVINETATVAAETASRVRAAIETLDYRPHTAARILAGHRTKTLGLTFPQISGYYFAALLRGIASGAAAYGYDLLIYSEQETIRDRTASPYPVGEHNTDGLLLFTDSLPESELRRLHARGFPVVLIHWSPPEDLNIPCVTIENKSSAARLVDHLITVHGSRRIVYLAGPQGHEDSRWREKGYRQALEAHGIRVDPALIAEGGFSHEIAHRTMTRLLEAGVRFDAVFAGDDDSAVGAMTALCEAGKRIPEDVAVVGFDDIEIAQYLTPPLTTVRAPVEQVGREAVDQLVRLIQTGEADLLTLLSTKLVIRHSCGCGVTTRKEV